MSIRRPFRSNAAPALIGGAAASMVAEPPWIMVDLPEPDGPQITSFSPRWMVRSIFFNTWKAPYHLFTPTISTAVGFVVGRDGTCRMADTEVDFAAVLVSGRAPPLEEIGEAGEGEGQRKEHRANEEKGLGGRRRPFGVGQCSLA